MNDNTERLLKQIRFLLIVVVVLLLIRGTFLFGIAFWAVLIGGLLYGILALIEHRVERKIASDSRTANESLEGKGSDDD